MEMAYRSDEISETGGQKFGQGWETLIWGVTYIKLRTEVKWFASGKDGQKDEPR